MKYCVLKTGYQQFDVLHAMGFCLIVSAASNQPVSLQDNTAWYLVEFEKMPTESPLTALKKIIAFPAVDSFKTFDKSCPTAEWITFDGLLVALFTTPGPRLVSVADVQGKTKLSPDLLKEGLAKVRKATSRWMKFVEKQTKQKSIDEIWDDFLSDYNINNPAIPEIGHQGKGAIKILMPIEPSLSFSSRQVFSNGKVELQESMAAITPKYASLLAFVGASQFLHAQRVAGKLVNLYLPLPDSVIIAHPCDALLLDESSFDSNIAEILYTLHFAKRMPNQGWMALSCQTLKTQGGQQSISVDRHAKELYPFMKLNTALLGKWQYLLIKARQLDIEVDSLTDFLLSGELPQFRRHLLELARVVLFTKNSDSFPLYTMQDLLEVTKMFDETQNTPLSAVLLNEKGLLRFGRALRQLKSHQNNVLREVVSELEMVKEMNDYLVLLSRIVEASVIQDSKNEFTIVPDEQDFYYLLEDVRRYGIRETASMLIILASLRYPRKNAHQPEDADVLHPDSAQGE
jgi:hypothetical protein